MSKLEDFVLDTLQFGPISAAGVLRRVEVMDLIHAIKHKFKTGNKNRNPRPDSVQLKGRSTPDTCTTSTPPCDDTKPVKPSSGHDGAMTDSFADTITNLKASEAMNNSANNNMTVESDNSPVEWLGSDVDSCSMASCVSEMSFDSNNDDIHSTTSTLSVRDREIESPTLWPVHSDDDSDSDTCDDDEDEAWPQVIELADPRDHRRQNSLITLVDNMYTIPEERLSVLSLSLTSDRETDGHSSDSSENTSCVVDGREDTVSFTSETSTLQQ